MKYMAAHGNYSWQIFYKKGCLTSENQAFGKCLQTLIMEHVFLSWNARWMFFPHLHTFNENATLSAHQLPI